MNKKILFTLWGCLFIVCAGLGFIPEPAAPLATLMTVLSLAFFVPPACLLFRGIREKDLSLLKLVQNFSLLSLALTAALLILNFLSAMLSEALGNFLYYLLVIVSSPMICSGYWAASLFLWACLLMVSLQELKKAKNESRSQ